MYGHINCDRDVILGERYCKFHFVPSLRIEIEKLQVENAKLKRCVEFYADEANQIAPIYKHDGRNRPGADFTAPYRMDEGKRARQVLKELEDK
jgi:hypothetical protein